MRHYSTVFKLFSIFLKDCSCSMTFWTGSLSLDDSHKRLYLLHYSSCPITMSTSLLSSSFNDNISCISHLLLYSQKGFFKADFNLLFEIIASCFSSGSPRTKSSSKHSSEQISNITKIKLSSSSTESSKIETSLSKSSSSETTFSISIILLSFILI